LRKAFEKSGIQYNISLFPWTRAYDMATNTANTCVYSTTRTDEREPLFKWVGPLVRNDWVLFGRADSPKLTSLNDAKPYTVGGYQGDALSIYLKSQGIKVDEANADHLNPQKLMAKRIDFWATGAALGPYLAAREGVTGLVPVLSFRETQMYLACNKAVPDDVIAKLNTAVKQLTDDGTLAAITKSYQ
jgi:polar amino acid transport system substrate-binding protein